MQLSLLEILLADEIVAEELFAPNGHRHCEHCRKRLHAFAGRLLCVNPHCPRVAR